MISKNLYNISHVDVFIAKSNLCYLYVLYKCMHRNYSKITNIGWLNCLMKHSCHMNISHLSSKFKSTSRYVIYWLTIWMTLICTDMRKLFDINWFFAPNHSTMRQKQHNIFYACLTFSVTEDVFSAICFHHDLSRCSIMVKWD